MRGYCGLVNAQAACRCARHVGPALTRGRIDPTQLLFAGRGESAPTRDPVLEAVGEMERLHEIAAIHQASALPDSGSGSGGGQAGARVDGADAVGVRECLTSVA